MMLKERIRKFLSSLAVKMEAQTTLKGFMVYIFKEKTIGMLDSFIAVPHF